MNFLGNLNKTTLSNLLLTLFILAYVNYAKAQDFGKNKDNLFFAEIGGSYAIPQALFASVDKNIVSSGYATEGFSINAFYGFHSRINLGFKIGASISFFGFDKSIDTISDDLNIPSNYKDEVKYKPWWFTNFFIGPTYQIKFNNISFDFSLITGISFSRRPMIEHKIVEPGNEDFNPKYYRYMPGEGTSFIIRPEFAIYFDISEKHKLKAFSSYQYTNPMISYQVISGNSYHNHTVKNHSLRMEIRWVEIGIAILFLK
ncbi:MAG: hypothetical protein C0598_11420 [Marinilabiliales bacterium]|nr:MAG: hypothetical protein C0598_11420 [Marinilabiliales bacterium]